MPKKPALRSSNKNQTDKKSDQGGIKAFESIAEGLLDANGVAQARMFGSHGLKINGKVFSMLVKDTLVVKLPQERVDALVESGKGDHFDPGHGRIMKEWIAVGLKSIKIWKELATEAMHYVGRQNREA